MNSRLLLRRVLILIALVGLVVVSGAIGIVAADWPHWHDRLRGFV